MNDPQHRRDFLTGRFLAHGVMPRLGGETDQNVTERETSPIPAPTAGPTIRLTTRAMACDFAIIMNPGHTSHVPQISDALDSVVEIEQQLSVYRDESELMDLNRRAFDSAVEVTSPWFELICLGQEIYQQTSGAFDPSTGPLITLWRERRKAGVIPTSQEIYQVLERVGMDRIEINRDARTIRFLVPGMSLDLGGIGKGYALDRIQKVLRSSDLQAWLLHGGFSSLLGWGDHFGRGGWPVGIGNPLFTDRRMGTLLLKDSGLSTSGSNVQVYRYQGKQFGHILDPRTGWPVDELLSVTVLAPTAAMADALSTAFFVLGVEKTIACCDNLANIGVILVPRPESGRRVCPIVLGIPPDRLFWDRDQVG